MTLTQTDYVTLCLPKTARKVAHKHSDAVGYVWQDNAGRPCAAMFYGRQHKPIWRFRFSNDAQREAKVTEAFENRKAHEDRIKANKAETQAWRHGFEPGDIFKSSWGYDQTNVDYYEVISTTEKMLTVRQIRKASSDEEGFMTARCVPSPGDYIGEPKKVLAQPGYNSKGPKDGYFKVASYANAYYEAPEIYAGVKVYKADRYSWYA
jgi:hypothetical protein